MLKAMEKKPEVLGEESSRKRKQNSEGFSMAPVLALDTRLVRYASSNNVPTTADN